MPCGTRRNNARPGGHRGQGVDEKVRGISPWKTRAIDPADWKPKLEGRIRDYDSGPRGTRQGRGNAADAACVISSVLLQTSWMVRIFSLAFCRRCANIHSL